MRNVDAFEAREAEDIVVCAEVDCCEHGQYDLSVRACVNVYFICKWYWFFIGPSCRKIEA